LPRIEAVWRIKVSAASEFQPRASRSSPVLRSAACRESRSNQRSSASQVGDISTLGLDTVNRPIDRASVLNYGAPILAGSISRLNSLEPDLPRVLADIQPV